MSEPGTIVLEEINSGEDITDEEEEEEEEDGKTPHEEQQVKKRKKKKVMIDWMCVNPVCPAKVTSKDLLQTASTFTTEFFGMPLDQTKKRKVCAGCRNQADTVRLAMKTQLVEGEVRFVSMRWFSPGQGSKEPGLKIQWEMKCQGREIN